jgi:hypothetical protein
MKGVCDKPRDLLNISDAVDKLGDRFGEDNLVVEALQTIRFCVTEGRGAGDAENWASVRKGCG